MDFKSLIEIIKRYIETHNTYNYHQKNASDECEKIYFRCFKHNDNCKSKCCAVLDLRYLLINIFQNEEPHNHGLKVTNREIRASVVKKNTKPDFELQFSEEFDRSKYADFLKIFIKDPKTFIKDQ